MTVTKFNMRRETSKFFWMYIFLSSAKGGQIGESVAKPDVCIKFYITETKKLWN